MLIRFACLFVLTLIASPVLAQADGTVADLVARIQRIEAQNRTLTGEVEQLTNLLRRSQEDFKRYREDTEFRLQALESKGGGKPPTTPPPTSQPPRRSDASPATPPRPAAGGPPKPLGAPPANLDELAAEAAGDTAANLNEGENPTAVEEGGLAGPPGSVVASPPRSGLTPPGLPGVAVAVPPAGGAPQPPLGPEAASLALTPEEEYTADYKLIEAKNYELAETAFRQFLVSYPEDKRVPDALHWLGESLFQRQQYRDAAEQFLKVTKDHQNSRRAPSSMLRLGTSLAALGEKEAACATFKEVGRRYPSAGPTVKTGTDKELKRNGC